MTLWRGTLLVCGLILMAAVGYMVWQGRMAVPETAQKVDFKPAEGVLVDRVRFRVNKDMGAEAISSTLPVATSLQEIPLSQSFVAVPVKQSAYVSPTEGDADTRTEVVPVSGAYLMKFSNAELCDANGACPIVLAAKTDGPELIHSTLFKVNAKNVWVSTQRHNGNPDLIVDYGVKGMPPVRMEWRTDGQYPSYEPVAPSQNAPLPELK